jgi:superoxide dismutase
MRGVPPVFSAVATTKHYQAHQDLFTKLNFLVDGTVDENKSLEELMLKHHSS